MTCKNCNCDGCVSSRLSKNIVKPWAAKDDRPNHVDALGPYNGPNLTPGKAALRRKEAYLACGCQYCRQAVYGPDANFLATCSGWNGVVDFQESIGVKEEAATPLSTWNKNAEEIRKEQARIDAGGVPNTNPWSKKYAY
jgi:hypothetical protein